MLFITQEEELQTDKPLQVLYFYASWMPFHRKYIIMINKMEEKYKDIAFCAIDVDQFSNRCKRFSIDSIPSVLILKAGQEIKRIKGIVLTGAFNGAFADICTS